MDFIGECVHRERESESSIDFLKDQYMLKKTPNPKPEKKRKRSPQNFY
jgi:hypothetical protein